MVDFISIRNGRCGTVLVIIGTYIIYLTSDVLVSKKPHEIIGKESFDSN